MNRGARLRRSQSCTTPTGGSESSSEQPVVFREVDGPPASELTARRRREHKSLDWNYFDYGGIEVEKQALKYLAKYQ